MKVFVKMARIAGKYRLVETINSAEILKVSGQEVTEEALNELNSKNSTLTVEVDGDNYILSTKIGDTWRREIKFTLGEPFSEGALFIKDKGETVVTKVGNKLIFTSSSKTKRLERYYEFTDNGVTLVLNTDSGMPAKRIFERM